MKPQILNNPELSMFCMEVSMFLHAGMDIGSSLTLIAAEETHLKDCLTEMADCVSSGSSLADAAENSGRFPYELIAMLRIGEKTGHLEEALNALAGYYTYRENAAQRIRSAVFYPCILLLVILAVIVLLLVKVVPIFNEIYASFGSEMLLPSWLLNTVLPAMCVLFGAGLIVLLCCRKSRTWLEKLPEHKKIADKIHTAHFAQALYMAVASGLSAEEAVETAGMILNHHSDTAERCGNCLEKLKQGDSLADACADSGLLPQTICRLLGLAAISGTMEQAALEAARRLQTEADDAVERAISRIEPALVLTASLLIGGILLGVMFPMANLLSLIG